MMLTDCGTMGQPILKNDMTLYEVLIRVKHYHKYVLVPLIYIYMKLRRLHMIYFLKVVSTN